MQLIDREAIMEEIGKLSLAWEYGQGVNDCVKIIEKAEEIIPFASVETQTLIEYERPKGEWLNDRVAFHFTCDYCGCNIRQLKSEVFEGNYNYNFCPNCGAEMKGGEDHVN